MNLIERLISLRGYRLAREFLAIYGLEVPAAVTVGEDLRIMHRGFGTVIHPMTVIGDRVRIYHQVTIGRHDAHLDFDKSKMEKIVIGNDVVLFPGAKVLGRAGITTLGSGTIVGANSVLSHSTGDNEIWAGAPARLVGVRKMSV